MGRTNFYSVCLKVCCPSYEAKNYSYVRSHFSDYSLESYVDGQPRSWTYVSSVNLYQEMISLHPHLRFTK